MPLKFVLSKKFRYNNACLEILQEFGFQYIDNLLRVEI